MKTDAAYVWTCLRPRPRDSHKGTFGAVLIPWNSNAIYASQMLGVSPLAFIPYCFLNYITPVIDLIYAKTGFTVKKIEGK